MHSGTQFSLKQLIVESSFCGLFLFALGAIVLIGRERAEISRLRQNMLDNVAAERIRFHDEVDEASEGIRRKVGNGGKVFELRRFKANSRVTLINYGSWCGHEAIVVAHEPNGYYTCEVANTDLIVHVHESHLQLTDIKPVE